MNTTITSRQLQNFLTLLEQKAMTPERFQKLLSSGMLADLCDPRANISNRGSVKNGLKHVIDCSANPFLPDGWSFWDHQPMGQIEWSLTKITLYLSQKQQEGSITGSELARELKDKPALNACVLDYLLDHPELIPEEWKKEDKYGHPRFIFFWGTTYYASAAGCFCVRGLSWDVDHWYGVTHYFLEGFGAGDSAVLLAA